MKKHTLGTDPFDFSFVMHIQSKLVKCKFTCTHEYMVIVYFGWHDEGYIVHGKVLLDNIEREHYSSYVYKKKRDDEEKTGKVGKKNSTKKRKEKNLRTVTRNLE